MPFLALSFDLGARDADVVDGICRLLGADAVTFTDRHDDPVLEPAPGELRLWPETRVQALFARGEPARLARALAHALTLDAHDIAMQAIEDRAWEREWLRDFHAMRFGRRLWVCPHHEIVEEPGAAIVQLDPGLAFGTGTHATTALCLEWLDSKLEPGCRVIDFGCGSGVLGLAAARLGAQAVWCHDHDPQALAAARDNAAVNALSDRVRVVASADDLPLADVLLANILPSTLGELAPTLARLVRPGGEAVLSGILERERDEVTHAHRAWFDTETFGAREGWLCLVARRRSNA
jgi:ribosomal protein L11 methyltransferase